MFHAKWSSGRGKYLEWEELRNVELSFFTVDNGYSEKEITMIKRLKTGDRLDLSEIGQYHEIEKI